MEWNWNQLLVFEVKPRSGCLPQKVRGLERKRTEKNWANRTASAAQASEGKLQTLDRPEMGKRTKEEARRAGKFLRPWEQNPRVPLIRLSSISNEEFLTKFLVWFRAFFWEMQQRLIPSFSRKNHFLSAFQNGMPYGSNRILLLTSFESWALSDKSATVRQPNKRDKNFPHKPSKNSTNAETNRLSTWLFEIEQERKKQKRGSSEGRGKSKGWG